MLALSFLASNKLDFISETSFGLESFYTTIKIRNDTVYLLRLLFNYHDKPETQLNSSSNQIMELITTFQKSPSKLRYITKKQREQAQKYLQELKELANNEIVAKFQSLTLDEPKSKITFFELTDHDQVIPEIKEIFQNLDAFHISVNPFRQMINLRGTKSEEEFYEGLKKQYEGLKKKYQGNFEQLKNILNYSGDFERPRLVLQNSGSGSLLDLNLFDPA